jgi:hypothetical protein
MEGQAEGQRRNGRGEGRREGRREGRMGGGLKRSLWVSPDTLWRPTAIHRSSPNMATTSKPAQNCVWPVKRQL